MKPIGCGFQGKTAPPGCPDFMWCTGNGVCYWRCRDDGTEERNQTMPVFEIPFKIEGKIKIEAEDAADAKAKLDESDLTVEQYAEQGELEVFEPVLEQTE